MIIEREYKALVKDPKSEQIPYVGTFKSQSDATEWFEKHKKSGKFSGLVLEVKRKLLLNGRPIRITSKQIIIVINVALISFIIWKIAQL